VIKLLARCAGAFALLTLLSPAWAFAQEPAAAPKNPAAVPTAEQITRILGQISEITGLKLKHPVPMSTLTKAEWRRWVDDRVRESAKPEEIRVEETAMKMFGFFPPEFDLRASTVDLMSEQAAAVYDHKKKRMIFVQDAAPWRTNYPTPWRTSTSTWDAFSKRVRVRTRAIRRG